MPAWFVVKCNEYARNNGLRPFVIYTGQWSVADRGMEREITAMCAHEGMAIAPWGVLGGGRFKTQEAAEAESKEGRIRVYPDNEHDMKIVEVLRKIAKMLKTLPTSVALAWMLQKQAHVFPLLGERKIEHVQASIDALSMVLTAEEMEEITAAKPFDQGFPLNILNFGGHVDSPADLALMTGTFDYVQPQQPIKPCI